MSQLALARHVMRSVLGRERSKARKLKIVGSKHGRWETLVPSIRSLTGIK